jgi:hypothetical protein
VVNFYFPMLSIVGSYQKVGPPFSEINIPVAIALRPLPDLARVNHLDAVGVALELNARDIGDEV